MSLCELAIGKETDKHCDYSCLPVYDQLFLRKKWTAKNVLEIGVLKGGSMHLWKEYFTAAQIYGIDFDLQDPCILDEPRISVIMDDAYSQSCVNFISKRKYDIIIDDGSHSLLDMFFVAQEYPRLLTSDGILVIEDIQQPEWVPKIIEKFAPEYQKYIEVCDLRDVKCRHDDMLIILDLGKKLS